MSLKNLDQVIIIKKRAHARHGHHGGAWKVAYADFVTAMMAFFLVMWIIGQGPDVRAGIAGYFRDPGAFTEGGKGLLPGSRAGTSGGSSPGSPAEAAALLENAAEQLRQRLAAPEFAALKDRVEISVTDEGLRIELREAPDDGFFASGSAAAKPVTVELLNVVARELGALPNGVAVEGHTDSTPYADPNGTYTNWELSVDRANVARRILEAAGLQQGQVKAVQGYADTRLRVPDKPTDPGNRRISIILRRA